MLIQKALDEIAHSRIVQVTEAMKCESLRPRIGDQELEAELKKHGVNSVPRGGSVF